MRENCAALFSGQLYTEKVDIWAVGVLAWELFSGTPPFAASTVKAINANVVKKKIILPAAWPEVCREFVGLCLNRDPEQRPDAKTLLEHRFLKQIR